MGGKVLNKKDPERVAGLLLLGAFPHRKKKRLLLDRLADRMLAADADLTDEEVCAVTLREIKRISDSMEETVLVIAGDNLTVDSLQILVNGLSKQDNSNQYLLVDTFGHNLITQQALDDCDSIIVAIGAGKTTMDSVKGIVSKALQYKKKVLGMVMYY